MPKRLDKCVKAVKGSGKSTSAAYAICKSAQKRPAKGRKK